MSTKQGGSVTIRDVAKRAGVSVSTASAALNNKPFVSPATRAKVVQAALELNYHVNRTARNLAVGRTHQIGLLIPARLEHTFSATDFFNQLVRGVYDACGQDDYSLVLYAVEDEAKLPEQVERWVFSRSVDGFLVTHPTWDMPYLRVLEEGNVPYVFVGRPPAAQQHRTGYVDNDNVSVAYDATKHLLELGHRHILLINGPGRYTYTYDRSLGYSHALAAYGLPLNRDLIVEAELTFTDGYQAVERLYGQVDFTAVVVLNPMQALGVIHALAKRGCAVPDDVSVVTMDCEMAACMYPPLTAVNIHPYRLGYYAAYMLLESVTGQEVEPRIVPHSLIVRDSTRSPEHV